MGTLYMNFINKIFTSYEVGFLKGTINRFYGGGPRNRPSSGIRVSFFDNGGTDLSNMVHQ